MQLYRAHYLWCDYEWHDDEWSFNEECKDKWELIKPTQKCQQIKA